MSMHLMLALVSGGLTLLALAVTTGAVAVCIDLSRRQRQRPLEVPEDHPPLQEPR